MIRYFCDMCKTQLDTDKIRKVKLTIPYSSKIKLHYCEKCFKKVLGEENYNGFMKKEFFKE